VSLQIIIEVRDGLMKEINLVEACLIEDRGNIKQRVNFKVDNFVFGWIKPITSS